MSARRWAALLAVVLVPPGIARAGGVYELRGLLDLGLVSSLEARQLNQVTFGESTFDPYRLRLFLDARLSPGLEVHVQSILGEGLGPFRADGAYALWSPWPGRDVSLEAGKIPCPVGVYAPRTYSDQNWLVGTPLLYQYRTGLEWDSITPDADALVAKAGRAQGKAAVPFLPLVDERWWDTGAAILGSVVPFEFSAGVTQGSLSWPSPGADDTPGQTVLGRLGLVPVAGVRLGVSVAEGSWMPGFLAFALPAGHTPRDYRESTRMADLELGRGSLEVRGEAAQRRWQTPYTGDLDVNGGYGEARWLFSDGAWLAVRGEALRFSDITTSTARRPWDDGVDRWEGVLGYRVSRDVRAKLCAQRTERLPFGAARVRDDLLAASLGIRF